MPDPAGISSGRAKRLVYDGKYHHTHGGLTKGDIVLNKHGKAVSRRKMLAGKRLQRENPWKQNSKFTKHIGKF